VHVRHFVSAGAPVKGLSAVPASARSRAVRERGSTSGFRSAIFSASIAIGVESVIGVQRVRIGLTGLAFVFILVLLGAVFTSPSAEESAANAVKRQLGGGRPAATAGNEEAPKEPLAKLGVAPGNADENGVGPPPAAAAAPAQR
jgi:hypothetical protein